MASDPILMVRARAGQLLRLLERLQEAARKAEREG